MDDKCRGLEEQLRAARAKIAELEEEVASLTASNRFLARRANEIKGSCSALVAVPFEAIFDAESEAWGGGDRPAIKVVAVQKKCAAAPIGGVKNGNDEQGERGSSSSKSKGNGAFSASFMRKPLGLSLDGQSRGKAKSTAKKSSSSSSSSSTVIAPAEGTSAVYEVDLSSHVPPASMVRAFDVVDIALRRAAVGATLLSEYQSGVSTYDHDDVSKTVARVRYEDV